MPPLYGPPTDSTDVAFPASFAEVPGAWLGSLGVGLALAALGLRLRSRLCFALGGTLLLTAPAGGLFASAVWGHYPTIDKAGSLHFYRLGAHFGAFDTSLAPTQLIGVSMGHLWVTQVLDWALAGVPEEKLPGFVAMNLQGLLNLALGWAVAAGLAEEAGCSRRAAMVAGFPVGLGLHNFRDLNWYTVEKSGVAWLALHLWLLLRAHRRGGLWIGAAAAAYAWAFFYNSYWGVLGAVAGAAVVLTGNRRSRLAVLASALAVLPLVAVQLPSLANAALPPPPAFAERAALDVLTLWPPAWNRLELWRALDPVMLALSGVAIGSKMPEKPAGEQEDTPVPSALWLLTGATVSGVLALGPVTPLWTAFASLPGLWRFAKPEAFVHLAILAVVPLAARGVGRLERRSRHAPGIALAAQVILWLWLVRSHPVYPGFSSLPG